MSVDLDRLWRAATDPDAPRVADPRVTAIRVEECGEELVDVTGRLAVRPELGQRAELGPAGTLVRTGVLARLIDASRMLDDLSIAVVEGMRPASRQDAEYGAERQRLAQAHPLWSQDRLALEASAFVAPADNNAPHLSGGAIDICVLDAAGRDVDMGTPVNGYDMHLDTACYTGYAQLPPEVRQLRARVAAAMTAAGFVNYPTEWWHWSYGDKWWAWSTGSETAPYGPCRQRQVLQQAPPS